MTSIIRVRQKYFKLSISATPILARVSECPLYPWQTRENVQMSTPAQLTLTSMAAVSLDTSIECSRELPPARGLTFIKVAREKDLWPPSPEPDVPPMST